MPRTQPTDATVQEYLEAIYTLDSEGRMVIGARLAEHLDVSPPSVAGMLQRLTRDEMVTIGPHKEITLTEKGRETAQAMVRRHRLSERLLTDILGMPWYEVHQEACQMEHAISPAVEERLLAVLGGPTTCPHGNPIPGQFEGYTTTIFPLSKASEGHTVVVVRVSEEAEFQPKLLEYLDGNRIKPGATLRVTQVAPYNGTITVSAEGHETTLGLQTADKIWTRAAEE